MANVHRGVFGSALLFLFSVTQSSGKCPEDYRHRVEMCVMEAQVAPQAGGGLSLITDPAKLEELCERGILQKTIDCLRDIYHRCEANILQKQELDMLFSIDAWKQGQKLLCEDLNRFRDHFECMSRFGPRISSCILIRTQMFKKAVTDVGVIHFKTLHDITCSFAQNIVNCLEYPLARSCPTEIVETMVSALHHFLPPTCIPVSDVPEAEAGQMLRWGDQESQDVQQESQEVQQESQEVQQESQEVQQESQEVQQESQEVQQESQEVQQESQEVQQESQEVQQESQEVQQENQEVQQESQEVQQESQEVQQESQEVQQESQEVQQESQEVQQESQEVQQESQEVQQESQEVQQDSQEVQQESQEVQQESQEVQQESQEVQQESQLTFQNLAESDGQSAI